MDARTPQDYDPHEGYLRLCKALEAREGLILAPGGAKKYGTRKEAAGKLGLSVSRLGNWKMRGLPEENVYAVARRLDIDVYYLLGTAPYMGRFGQTAVDGLSDHLLNELTKLKKQIDRRG